METIFLQEKKFIKLSNFLIKIEKFHLFVIHQLFFLIKVKKYLAKKIILEYQTHQFGPGLSLRVAFQ